MAAGDGAVPAELTSYVGRQQEAAQVRGLLGAGRLVTLTGPGGVGKTRLSVRVLRDVAPGYPDGVWFAGLAELRDGTLVANLVADRLGLHDKSGKPVTERVLDYLRDRTALLVLDNCEHLVQACAEFVHAVLTSCPRVAVLATGRQSLGIDGEQVLRVPPLSVPDSAEEPPDAYDGVRLFVDRASAVWPSFRLTPGNRADVVRLCRRLEGLPLAVELAAARVRSLSPKAIADRLAGGLALLTTGLRTAPQRQQTLRATIDWSYGLCSAAEQAVWARASVFAGSFDLDAVEYVCAGPGAMDPIDGLVDKSVLLRDDADGVVRYRMLETLREYGQERLDEARDRARVARRHRDWFDRLTARADAEWAGGEQLGWVGRLRRDHANLRAALEWSVAEPGEGGVALRMASRLDEYWTLRGFNGEARMWLERALAATPPEHPDRPRALAVCALHALWQSDLRDAAELLDRAEETAAGTGDDLLTATITHVRSLEAMIRLDPRATELAATAAATFRAHGDLRGELRSLFQRGLATTHVDDLDTGRGVLRRVIALSESSGATYYRDMALFGLALIEVQFGDVEAAAVAARTALESTRTRDSRFGDAYHTETLAWIADRQGDHERAARLFGAASVAWEVLGSAPEVAVSLPHRQHRKSTLKALGADRFDAAFGAGRALSKEQARRYALGEDGAEDPAPGEADPLTRREREVAELVADGLSNREIAAELVISPRTATTHVQRILTKLGFGNRAQIAAWITGRRS